MQQVWEVQGSSIVRMKQSHEMFLGRGTGERWRREGRLPDSLWAAWLKLLLFESGFEGERGRGTGRGGWG